METEVLERHVGSVVTCGTWSLALDMNWTNAIIDGFEVVHVPRSPPWLAGVVNFEGGIVPVIDLAVYFDPGKPSAMHDRHHRLVLGGRVDGSIEGAVAILFTGLPMQVEYTREPLDNSGAIPERLREVCIGMARSSSGQLSHEIKVSNFVETLSMGLI